MKNTQPKCPGSFKTFQTDVAGAVYTRDKNSGQLKVTIPCPVCGRQTGLRSRLKGGRGILAQHAPKS